MKRPTSVDLWKLMVCASPLCCLWCYSPLISMIRGTRKVSPYDFHMTEDELEARRAELLRLEQAALEPASRTALASHERSYKTFCHSARIQAFPVSYVSLDLFFVQYCRWAGHTARSIPSIYRISSEPIGHTHPGG